MSTSVVTRPKTAIEKMKDTIAMPSVQEQFKNALADNSALFVASLIDVYASDTYLQKCEPGLVIMEALKAATLRLPINKSLGFAYIVPYDKSVKVGDQWVKKSTPQFQIGYKGYIQLAQRTGQYRYLNADVVLDGELKGHDKLTGTIDLSGETSTGEVIGYFAHIETVTGFRKTVYWSKSRVEAHALRYSQAYQADVKSKKQNSPWSKQFDEMATKTVLKALLSKYGVMSVEMVAAMTADTSDETTPEQRLDIDVTESANKDFLDIEPESVGTEAEKGQDNPPPDKDWPPAELPPIRTDGDSFREQRAVIDSRQTKPAATGQVSERMEMVRLQVRFEELKAVISDLTDHKKVMEFIDENHESITQELGEEKAAAVFEHGREHIKFIKAALKAEIDAAGDA